jgi:hypothetical protein
VAFGSQVILVADLDEPGSIANTAACPADVAFHNVGHIQFLADVVNSFSGIPGVHGGGASDDSEQ